MKAVTKQLILSLLLICIFAAFQVVEAADYTPGDFHNYTHAAGNVPEDAYQYSVYVPTDYDPAKSYPLVFYLHGGGRGRSHPDQAKRNMVSERLKDNNRTTDAGYTRNAKDFIGYILVSPVKPVMRWKADIFKRLYRHVKTKVSIDENRVYVTGFSMGGQGTWHVGCGADDTYNIAAMMPLGAWGCNEVKRGATPQTCKTTKTAVWVLHCPLDPVSKIAEQLTLFHSHLDSGGYGRFTMIPGKGHISRPPDDREFFSMRMAWMLAQTYGTPFNYVVKVNNGAIAKVESGKRPHTADNNHYGFYEPGTVLNLTAPETNNGKPFIKWAAHKGAFAEASARSTSYTTPTGDVVISAVYDTQPYNLTIVGGAANPPAPLPGQIVTVTAHPDINAKTFSYWTTATPAIDIPVPSAKSLKFAMPAENVTLSVHRIK